MTRRRRVIPVLLAGCAVAAVALGGCTVDGTSQPDISARLLAPTDFPSGVTATRVDGAAARSVLADLVGEVPGGRVVPAECAPTPVSTEPADNAAMVAQLPADSAHPGTLTVAATRSTRQLSETQRQAAQCTSFVRTNAAGASSTVRQTVIAPGPASSVPGVTTLGIARTQTTGGNSADGTGTAAVGVASKTYLAQRDGIRLYVVYRGVATAAAAGADPQQVASEHTPDLDALFDKAVSAAFG